METIIFLAGSISCIESRTQFQRAKLFANNFDTYFLLAQDLADDCSEEFRASLKVKVCPGGTVFFYLLIFPFWAIWTILKISRQKEIYAILSTQDMQALITGWFCKKLGWKWIADIFDHPELPIEGLKGYSQVRYKLLKYFFTILRLFIVGNLKNADLIILALEPEALDGYGVDFGKVIKVTNGVNIIFFDNALKNWKLENDTNQHFRVIYVGHIMRARGIDLVLEAAAKVNKMVPRAEFMVIGPGRREDKEYLDEQIRAKELNGIVRYLGKLEHLRTMKEVFKADICLYPFPNVKELSCIYPIKVFEYMALEKPVIATNLKGVRRIIKNGETGILVEGVEEVVQSIIKLYNDNELRNRLGRKARWEVTKFDWNQINANLLSKIQNFVKDNQ